MSTSGEADRPDRRSQIRFPLRGPASFRSLDRRLRASGQTINVSDSGVLLAIGRSPLGVGERIEISMDWPACPDNCGPVTLMARGQIVRIEEGAVAIRIHNYRFKMQRPAN